MYLLARPGQRDSSCPRSTLWTRTTTDSSRGLKWGRRRSSWLDRGSLQLPGKLKYRDIPDKFRESFSKCSAARHKNSLWHNISASYSRNLAGMYTTLYINWEFDEYLNIHRRLISFGNYRVTHLVANLGWVDFDLGCSTILLGQ